MVAIFSDVVEKSIEIFIDDFSMVGASFEDCLDKLELVLKICKGKNLVLN